MPSSSILSNSICAVFNFSRDKRLGRACTRVVMWYVTLWFKYVLLNDGVVIVAYFSKSALICVVVVERAMEGLNCLVTWTKSFILKLITGSTYLLFMSICRLRS